MIGDDANGLIKSCTSVQNCISEIRVSGQVEKTLSGNCFLMEQSFEKM
jgi:hypothetical protein